VTENIGIDKAFPRVRRLLGSSYSGRRKLLLTAQHCSRKGKQESDVPGIHGIQGENREKRLYIFCRKNRNSASGEKETCTWTGNRKEKAFALVRGYMPERGERDKKLLMPWFKGSHRRNKKER